MRNPFQRLLRQGGLYAIGNLALKASGLILAPLYLNPVLLSQAAFGYLIMLEATAQLAIPFIGLGLTSGLLKYSVDPDLEDRAAVPFTTLVVSVGAAFLGIGLLWLLSPLLASLLLGSMERAFLVRLLALYVGFKVISAIPLMLVRTQEKVGLYVLATVAEAVVLICGVYYFLQVRRMGLEGILWAYVLSSGLSALVLTATMLARTRWVVESTLIGRLIRFSVPLMLGGVALPLLHVGDRYLLEWLAGAVEVAVYGWAAKLSGIVNMLVVQSFQLTFSIVGLKSLGEREEGAALHRRTFRHYSIGAGWVALGLSLLAYDVTAFLSSSPDYLEAVPLVLPLSLGYLLYGFFAVSQNVLYATNKTYLVTAAVVSAVVFNVLLNLFLIPLWGGMGAALATVAAYSLLILVTTRAAEKLVEITFPWHVLLAVLGIVLFLWGLAQFAMGWTRLQRLFWFAFLLLAYPGLVLTLRLYTRAEIAAGWAWLWEKMRSMREPS